MASEIMKSAYRRWLKSDIEYLCGANERCAYRSCSDKKWDAWKDCQKLMDEKGGERMRFIGVSITVFSCGFTYQREDGEKMFMYITPSYNRECKISELIN